jgi:hypothetical protein
MEMRILGFARSPLSGRRARGSEFDWREVSSAAALGTIIFDMAPGEGRLSAL